MANLINIVVVKRATNSNELSLEVIKDFDDTLQNIYEKLQIDTIDIVQRRFKGHWLNVIVDDNGLINKKENDLPTACFMQPIVEQLYGSLMLTGLTDEEGELTSLNMLEINSIFESVKKCVRTDRNDTTKKVTFEILVYDYED